jgi:hypothetical protein
MIPRSFIVLLEVNIVNPNTRTLLAVMVTPLMALSILGLAGFHEPPKAHSITVTWKASASTHDATIVGYNVYRRTATTAPYDKIASQIAGTTYEDHLVKSGTTYYYAVRSVDQHGHESNLSTEITAKIP